MQVHSSAGTITTDSGCLLYKEYLLLKQKLSSLKSALDTAERRIIYEQQHEPDDYKFLQERVKIHNKAVNRIKWFETEYHNFLTDQSPEWILKRRRIEVKVLGE